MFCMRCSRGQGRCFTNTCAMLYSCFPPAAPVNMVHLCRKQTMSTVTGKLTAMPHEASLYAVASAGLNVVAVRNTLCRCEAAKSTAQLRT